MLPHPAKHRAGLTLEMLTALGCKYKYAREDVLCRSHAVICSNAERQCELHLFYALP